MTIFFLIHFYKTGHRRTERLEEDLGNQFDKGVNIYPCNLENTTNIIISYKTYIKNTNHPGKKNNQSKK